MKKIYHALLLTFLPICAFATGLNFQTLNPAVGDILSSASTEISLSATVRFGTLSGNADFTSGTASYSTFGDFDSAFSSLVSGSVLEGSPNNVTGSIAATTLSAGLNLWLLVEDGGEQGVFYLGVTPGLGQLDSNPQAITEGIGGANVAIGSFSGNNILLASAVPEPSAFAAISGFLALGWVMLRRRRA